MLIKIDGLHQLSHIGEEHYEECEICEYVITLNTTPFSINEQVVVNQPIQHSYRKQLFYEYSYRFTPNLANTTLFCRPPPTL